MWSDSDDELTGLNTVNPRLIYRCKAEPPAVSTSGKPAHLNLKRQSNERTYLTTSSDESPVALRPIATAKAKKVEALSSPPKKVEAVSSPTSVPSSLPSQHGMLEAVPPATPETVLPGTPESARQRAELTSSQRHADEESLSFLLRDPAEEWEKWGKFFPP